MNRRGFFGMLMGVAVAPLAPKLARGWQSMDRGIFIGECDFRVETDPTVGVPQGGFMYSVNGTATWRDGITNDPTK